MARRKVKFVQPKPDSEKSELEIPDPEPLQTKPRRRKRKAKVVEDETEQSILPPLIPLVDTIQRIAKRPKGQIPADIREYAAIADTSYIRNFKNRDLRLKKHLKGETKWVLERGDKYMTSYLDEDKKTVVTTFRGTDPKDASDLRADLHIAMGGEQSTKRFKHARTRFAQLLEDYPSIEYRHVLASHSLGGSINTHIAHFFKDDVDEVHNFNPGSGASHVLSGIRGKYGKRKSDDGGNGVEEEGEEEEVEKKIHNHMIIGDPVSMVAQFFPDNTVSHTYLPVVGSSNPHSMSQFLK